MAPNSKSRRALERAPNLVREVFAGLPDSAELLTVVPGGMGWYFDLRLAGVHFRVVYDRGFVETYEVRGPTEDVTLAVVEGEKAATVIEAIRRRVPRVDL